MSPLSRRTVLRRISLGIGVALAGCSTASQATQPSPSSKPPRSPSPCSEELVVLDEVRKDDLEEGTYEIVPFGNLSTVQQQTFEQSLKDGQASLVEEKESWYRYVEYQHSKQRLSMVIQYNRTLYGVEVHHLDYC
ncbi:MAG: hypothetical protein R3324_04700 [Halobacteriales archaeon]|nr:hypothetical protein [Halobacteriales archaeon]